MTSRRRRKCSNRVTIDCSVFLFDLASSLSECEKCSENPLLSDTVANNDGYPRIPTFGHLCRRPHRTPQPCVRWSPVHSRSRPPHLVRGRRQGRIGRELARQQRPIFSWQRAWRERGTLSVGVVMGPSGGSVRWSRLAEGNVGPGHVSFAWSRRVDGIMIDETSSWYTVRVNLNDLCCYVRLAENSTFCEMCPTARMMAKWAIMCCGTNSVFPEADRFVMYNGSIARSMLTR